MRVIKGLPIIMLAIFLGLAGVSCDQLKEEISSSSSGGSSSSDGGSSDCGQASDTCISGTVTLNGAGLSGVTMSLSGYATATTTTDAGGNYSFRNLKTSSASYTTYYVTATKTGYTFRYGGYSYTDNTVDVTFVSAGQYALGVDFTAYY